MYRTLASFVYSLALLASVSQPVRAADTANAGVLSSSSALAEAAEQRALEGDYEAALPLFERAISSLADNPGQQHELRYRYGIILNALAAQHEPGTYYPLARAQFEAILDYQAAGGQITHSPARVTAALAHTFHQQSAHELRATQRSQFLREAYRLYRDAAGVLEQQEEWHNLSITFFNIGQVCEWQGNLEEAIDWVERAVALDRQHGLADLEEDLQYLLALRELVNPTKSTAETAL